MGLYRKKPVVIEARRIASDSDFADVTEWVRSQGGDMAFGRTPVIGCISTLEGVMQVNVGDWIIKGVKGEFYPCRNDIFQQTYEPAEALV